MVKKLNAPQSLWWILPAVAVLFLLIVPGLAFSQQAAMENQAKIKAAFLRNFAHYVTWPDKAFPDADMPWQIGILGPDPFGNGLEATFEGRKEQGRSFKVFRADSLKKLPSCQIIFVTFDDATKRRAALSELKDKPVLTVGDAPDFLQEGGIIAFKVADRIKMSINLDQTRAVSINIQTKMLEVASGILENGEISRVR